MPCAVLTHLQVKTFFSTKRDIVRTVILSDFFSRGYENILLWNQENDAFIKTAPEMAPERSIKTESMGEADVTECKLHFGKLILQGLLIHSAGFVFDRAKKLQGSCSDHLQFLFSLPTDFSGVRSGAQLAPRSSFFPPTVG
jgi:hypothetical protein